MDLLEILCYRQFANCKLIQLAGSARFQRTKKLSSARAISPRCSEISWTRQADGIWRGWNGKKADPTTAAAQGLPPKTGTSPSVKEERKSPCFDLKKGQ